MRSSSGETLCPSESVVRVSSLMPFAIQARAVGESPEGDQRYPRSLGAYHGIWEWYQGLYRTPVCCRRVRLSFRILKYAYPTHVRCCRMKAILFILLRAFQFELAVDSEDVARTGTLLQRPSLLSQPEMGTQMPLIVTEYVGLDR